MQAEEDAAGKIIVHLSPGFGAPGVISPGTPARRFAERGMALSMAHQELLKEDEYWRRVGELETAVIPQLGMRATMRQGRMVVYAAALERGIFHDIVRRAGVPDLDVIPPPFRQADPYGSDQPFLSGGKRPVNPTPHVRARRRARTGTRHAQAAMSSSGFGKSRAMSDCFQPEASFSRTSLSHANGSTPRRRQVPRTV